jgi:type IV secretion system protein VirB3
MNTRPRAQLIAEPLFVGATRPAMRWGVTYSALLCNLIFTLEAFLVTRNLCALLLCIPLHALCALLCLQDPRFFDLAVLWARTRLPALYANHRLWGAGSYSPLSVRLADRRGRRPRAGVAVCIAPAREGAP